jgi:hypothetical protein
MRAGLTENQSLRKALSECHQQLERANQPNLPPQQCPPHVFFLPQKADPCLRVRDNVQIRLADMPLPSSPAGKPVEGVTPKR